MNEAHNIKGSDLVEKVVDVGVFESFFFLMKFAENAVYICSKLLFFFFHKGHFLKKNSFKFSDRFSNLLFLRLKYCFFWS